MFWRPEPQALCRSRTNVHICPGGAHECFGGQSRKHCAGREPHIHLQMNNMSAVTYIQGGTKSLALNDKVLEM